MIISIIIISILILLVSAGARLRRHLPLALVDLLLQALQVGQEGLIELGQLDIL